MVVLPPPRTFYNERNTPIIKEFFMKYAVLAFALCAVSPAFAATDWTNYLKGMQNGCNYPRETIQKKTSIPKSLHASISKYSVKAGADAHKSVDIRLKNATAFGKSITRIVMDNSQWGSGTFHVYFNDGNFSKLKSKFFISINGQNHSVGAKKAWIMPEENIDDEDPQATMTANSTPYQGSDRKKYSALMNDTPNTLILVHDNGWLIDGMSWEYAGAYKELIFDSKNKRISCEFAFG